LSKEAAHALRASPRSELAEIIERRLHEQSVDAARRVELSATCEELRTRELRSNGDS
jgi:hypothetical protein